MDLGSSILTGVGFIGGGAILRRGDFTLGVTTAATIWIITVIGLCFGGGQLALGCLAIIFAVVTLWMLRSVEARILREHRATVVVSTAARPALSPAEVRRVIGKAGYSSRFLQQQCGSDDKRLTFEVRRR
jgi:putative Mg2+ transporter-C (MgtC) family protein